MYVFVGPARGWGAGAGGVGQALSFFLPPPLSCPLTVASSFRGDLLVPAPNLHDVSVRCVGTHCCGTAEQRLVDRVSWPNERFSGRHFLRPSSPHDFEDVLVVVVILCFFAALSPAKMRINKFLRRFFFLLPISSRPLPVQGLV